MRRRLTERDGRKYARAFTLIELLLVITLMGIICLAVTPTMVRSIRGNRLRFAARTVISSGRYARSMAVMRQVRTPLLFDMKAGRISVGGDGTEQQGFNAVATASALSPTNSNAATNAAVAGAAPAFDVYLERTLDGARIESVEIAGAGSVADGVCEVIYEQNGRCLPYTVELADEHGEAVTIEVDALATPKATWRR